MKNPYSFHVEFDFSLYPSLIMDEAAKNVSKLEQIRRSFADPENDAIFKKIKNEISHLFQ